MGTETNFFDGEGVARPKIVEALRALPNPPHDPELLARFIDGHAGVDIDFSLIGLDAQLRAARTATFEALGCMKAVAEMIAPLHKQHSELNLLEIAIADSVESQKHDHDAAVYVDRLSRAVQLFAEIPLRKNLTAFGGKPLNDQTVYSVVCAVQAYYERLGMPFRGAPRRTETADGPIYPIHSPQARLTKAVLDLLGFPIPEPALATHMSNARKNAANLRSLPSTP